MDPQLYLSHKQLEDRIVALEKECATLRKAHEFAIKNIKKLMAHVNHMKKQIGEVSDTAQYAYDMAHIE